MGTYGIPSSRWKKMTDDEKEQAKLAYESGVTVNYGEDTTVPQERTTLEGLDRARKDMSLTSKEEFKEGMKNERSTGRFSKIRKLFGGK